MSSKSLRQQVKERNRKQKRIANFIGGGVGVAVIAILGVLIWQGFRPAMGESFPIIVLLFKNYTNREDYWVCPA